MNKTVEKLPLPLNVNRIERQFRVRSLWFYVSLNTVSSYQGRWPRIQHKNRSVSPQPASIT